MPDLTDADLEAMEQRHQGTLDDQERYGLGTRQIDDDIGTLIAALREARRERDEAQLARDLFQRQEADAIRYWQQALAEGRLLREALLEWKFVTQSMAGPDLIDAMEQGYEALNATPIVAAEVERVRRLEDEVELRECKDNWLREALLNKHEIRFVDATPDDGLPFRILRAYIDHTSWADNTLGIEPSSPLCAELNQLQASRNRIIERALAELEEGEG